MTIKTWRVDIINDQIKLHEMEIFPEPHSLNEVTLRLPSGAYTTFRTYYGRKVLRIYDQVERLENTATLVDCQIKIREVQFREALRNTIALYPKDGELRFRVSVDLSEQIGSIYITVEQLQVPPAVAYQQGVDVLTCELNRDKPKAKLTNFISQADVVRSKLPPGVHEALIVNSEGKILEGLSSNFFAIIRGEIWTEEEIALSGITRALVLDCLHELNLVVYYRAIGLAQVPVLEEAFITSASRGVLPVQRINQYKINQICPGELTREISKLYEARIQAEVEPI